MKKGNMRCGILTVMIYVIFLLVLIATVALKRDFHTDEIFSYGLANHTWDGVVSMKVDMGKIYQNPQEPYLKYMTVSKEHRFDYKNVWINQSHDVHPPLYYAILHTICSFFPEKFSVWYAGIINIIFAMLSLFLIRKLMTFLTNNKIIVFVTSIGFVLCSGVISNVSFLRMYVMTMFWILLILYMFLIILRSGVSKRNLFQLSLVIVFSALTHYYCIVFAVLISCVYGIILIINHKWKNLCSFCTAMIFSGVVTIAIFPGMIGHIFGGYRGEEAFDNLKNASDFGSRIKIFGDLINNQLYGGLLFVIILTVILVYLSMGYMNKYRAAKNVYENMIMLLPIVSYFLIISKIAAYEADRYLFPVYGVMYVVGIYYIYELVFRFFPEQQSILIICLIVSLVSCNGLQKAEWPYLYRNTEKELASLEAYKGKDCVYISSGGSWLHWKWPEMTIYRTITYVLGNDMSKLPDFDEECTELVVIISGLNSPETYLDSIMKKYPKLKQCSKIAGTTGGVNYYLSAE